MELVRDHGSVLGSYRQALEMRSEGRLLFVGGDSRSSVNDRTSSTLKRRCCCRAEDETPMFCPPAAGRALQQRLGGEDVADSHLGNVFRSISLTCDYSDRRSELTIFDGPRLSGSHHCCQRRVVFPWCGCQGISYDVHHIGGDIFGTNPRAIASRAPVEGHHPPSRIRPHRGIDLEVPPEGLSPLRRHPTRRSSRRGGRTHSRVVRGGRVAKPFRGQCVLTSMA